MIDIGIIMIKAETTAFSIVATLFILFFTAEWAGSNSGFQHVSQNKSIVIESKVPYAIDNAVFLQTFQEFNLMMIREKQDKQIAPVRWTTSKGLRALPTPFGLARQLGSQRWLTTVRTVGVLRRVYSVVMEIEWNWMNYITINDIAEVLKTVLKPRLYST